MHLEQRVCRLESKLKKVRLHIYLLQYLSFSTKRNREIDNLLKDQDQREEDLAIEMTKKIKDNSKSLPHQLIAFSHLRGILIVELAQD